MRIPILHRSLISPYSEKLMVLMGYLGIPWRSVIAPKGIPRPVQQVLVGAYSRRIPIMQQGADLYCDSTLILRELARSTGQQTLCPTANASHRHSLMSHIDECALTCMVDSLSPWELVSGYFRLIPPKDAFVFLRDRSRLARRLKRVDPDHARQPRDEAAVEARNLLESLDRRLEFSPYLNDDSGTLGSSHPSSASPYEQPTELDFTAFTMLWYHQQLNGLRLADGLPRLRDWLSRMIAFGHGTYESVAPAQALTIAKQASPAAIPDTWKQSPLYGKHCCFRPQDRLGNVMDFVEGEVVGANQQRIVIRRVHPEIGETQIHFPASWANFQ